MTSTRAAGALIGIVFGVVLSWSGMTSPEVIREGLLFQSGIWWGIPTTIGLIGGILLFRRLQARAPNDRMRTPAASVIPSPVAADATA